MFVAFRNQNWKKEKLWSARTADVVVVPVDLEFSIFLVQLVVLYFVNLSIYIEY